MRIPSQRLLTHRGRLLAEIGMGNVWGDVGACLALPRASLHRMLRDGLPLRLARTHRLDRTRGLPPPVRNLVLRSVGRRIFQTDYRPLLEPVGAPSSATTELEPS